MQFVAEYSAVWRKSLPRALQNKSCVVTHTFNTADDDANPPRGHIYISKYPPRGHANLRTTYTHNAVFAAGDGAWPGCVFLIY